MTDDVHFHREHLLHFHADGQVVRAVLGDGGVDAGVAPDLADDTQRRALCGFADELEQAEDFGAALKALITREITAHKRIIFNGNGYADEWVRRTPRAA